MSSFFSWAVWESWKIIWFEGVIIYFVCDKGQCELEPFSFVDNLYFYADKCHFFEEINLFVFPLNVLQVPILPGDAYASTMPCQLRVHLMIMKPVSKLLVYTGVIDKSSLSGLPKFDWMPIGTGRMGM
ncbi:hypothetical protein Peur_069010 [Populus x canadensis]